VSFNRVGEVTALGEPRVTALDTDSSPGYWTPFVGFNIISKEVTALPVYIARTMVNQLITICVIRERTTIRRARHADLRCFSEAGVFLVHKTVFHEVTHLNFSEFGPGEVSTSRSVVAFCVTPILTISISHISGT